MILKTKTPSPTESLSGLLRGLAARGQQVRGSLETVALHRLRQPRTATAPASALELDSVPTYGELVLRNHSTQPLIVPMHIGFVQGGAQNHATAQVSIIPAGDSLKVEDAFCVQERQCGYLKGSTQRFLMLPFGLRHRALSVRGETEFGRLWSDIDAFTRRYGISKGGHLERFLRPYFRRMVPYRHAFEPEPGQSGAAFYVGDELVGVEVLPSPAHYAELAATLAIYSYAPAAILHDLESDGPSLPRQLDLLGVASVDDLLERLEESRAVDARSRIEPLQELSEQAFDTRFEGEHEGLRLFTVEHGPFLGQIVRQGEETLYVSLVRRP